MLVQAPADPTETWSTGLSSRSSHCLANVHSDHNNSQETSATSFGVDEARVRTSIRDQQDSQLWSQLRASRAEWFALRLLDSDVFRLEKTDVFWKSLEKGHPSTVAFAYPPLFESICICDAEVCGNPVYLQSESSQPLHPRALNVGAAQFLNFGPTQAGLAVGGALLSSTPTPEGRMDFNLEMILPLARVTQAHDHTSNPALIASLPITEQILQLSRNLMARYDSGGDEPGPKDTGPKDCAAQSPVTDSVDWIEASNIIPSEHLLKHIPLDDTDVVEIHRFFIDIAQFYQNFIVLQVAGGIWQITHASHLIAAQCDAFDGDPPFQARDDLSERLAKPEAFSTDILWGHESVHKRMYCVPLYRGNVWICWTCFLLAANIPHFWTHKLVK